jgi:hypothetical protein
MLIQPDKDELGDKRLDPAETVAAKREEMQGDVSGSSGSQAKLVR